MPLPAKDWQLHPPAPEASALAQTLGISAFQAQLLINRGIARVADMRAFLEARLGGLAHPSGLKDMDRAVALVREAMVRQTPLAVYGDYDADGLTATAVLVHFFRDLGVPAVPYIPHRITEGYGLNAPAVERLAREGVGLLITVDCGIANAAEIELAQRLGLKVIVTDHHQIPDGFQAASPVLNPRQPGCGFNFKELAGVGLAFYLAAGVRAGLRAAGWFDARPEPDLRDYLDLVAIGTIADRVPLKGLNRLLVRAGLARLADSRWPGVRALKRVCDMGGNGAGVEAVAFRLAPRLNAPGRVGDPHTSLALLLAREAAAAEAGARQLDQHNAQRQALERRILAEIDDRLAADGGTLDRGVFFLGGEDWHIGVLGIVASRLVDQYQRPAFVMNTSGEVAVGSARSVDGFDLYAAMKRCGHRFERFGGHTHAAGFRLKRDAIAALRDEMETLALGALGEERRMPGLMIDAEVRVADLVQGLFRELQALEPFGEGNPEPCLLTRNLRVAAADVVGRQHLRLKLLEEGRGVDAMGFGLGAAVLRPGDRVDLVYTPEMHTWQGCASFRLRILDWAPAA